MVVLNHIGNNNGRSLVVGSNPTSPTNKIHITKIFLGTNQLVGHNKSILENYMDIFTINTIINTIEKLTSEGQEMFFWWIIVDKIIPSIISIILFISTIKIIKYGIKIYNDDPKDRVLQFLSKELKNPQISSELTAFIKKLKNFINDY